MKINKIYKNISLIFILFIILANNSFATEDNQICQIEEEKVYVKENFTLAIDLEKINFDSFKITIQSNTDIEVVENDSNTEIDKNDNKITIDIENKEEFTSKVKLVYTAPDSAQTIKLKITIDSKEDTELENNILEDSEIKQIIEEINVEVEEKDTAVNDSEQNKDEEDENKENMGNLENTDEKKEDDIETNKQEQNRNENAFSNEVDNIGGEKSNNLGIQAKMQEVINVSSKQVVSNNRTSASTIESYKGDRNNYLLSLSIDGVDFKNEFKKTTQTYFAKVEDISSVNVNATPEDDNAVVTIYGNEELESEMNKILVQVTAENGDIRSYRIFIEK